MTASQSTSWKTLPKWPLHVFQVSKYNAKPMKHHETHSVICFFFLLKTIFFRFRFPGRSCNSRPSYHSFQMHCRQLSHWHRLFNVYIICFFMKTNVFRFFHSIPAAAVIRTSWHPFYKLDMCHRDHCEPYNSGNKATWYVFQWKKKFFSGFFILFLQLHLPGHSYISMVCGSTISIGYQTERIVLSYVFFYENQKENRFSVLLPTVLIPWTSGSFVPWYRLVTVLLLNRRHVCFDSGCFFFFCCCWFT